MSTLTRGLTLLLAAACALAVATVYLAQPLLESMAASLGVSSARAGLIVGMTQAGYALGLLQIVPLGDLLDRKQLILGQLLVSSGALLAVAFAVDWAVLLAAMALVGLAAVLALAMAGLLAWRLPVARPQGQRQRYRALLASVLRLYRHDRLLRERGVFAVLVFAAFSVLWSAMVLPLSAAPLALDHTQVGLFGLAGVAGALAASRAGRLADHGHGRRVTGWALGLLTLSWLPIAYLEQSLLALVVGILMLDLAVQAVHVTNQSLLLAGRGEMAGRLIGAYMCCYSLGSGVGAVVATWVYGQWGWVAVCGVGAGISALAWGYWGYLWSVETMRGAPAPEGAGAPADQNL